MLYTKVPTDLPSSLEAPALCSPLTSSRVSSGRRDAQDPQWLLSRSPMLSSLTQRSLITVINVMLGSQNDAFGTCTDLSRVNVDRVHSLQPFTNRAVVSLNRSRVGLRLRVVQPPTGVWSISGLMGVLLTVIGVCTVVIKPRHARRFLFFILFNEGVFFMGQPLGLPLLTGLLFSRTRSRRYGDSRVVFGDFAGPVDDVSTVGLAACVPPLSKYTLKSQEFEESYGPAAASVPELIFIHPRVPLHNYFSPLKNEEYTYAHQVEYSPCKDPSLLRYVLALQASAYRRILIQRGKKVSSEPCLGRAEPPVGNRLPDKLHRGYATPIRTKYRAHVLMWRALYILYLSGINYCSRWSPLRTLNDIYHTFSLVPKFNNKALAKIVYGSRTTARSWRLMGATFSGGPVFKLVLASNFGDDGLLISSSTSNYPVPLLQTPRYIANLTVLNLERHMTSSATEGSPRHIQEEHTALSSYVTAWLKTHLTSLSAKVGREPLGWALGASGANRFPDFARQAGSYKSGSPSSAGRFSIGSESVLGLPDFEGLTAPHMEAMDTEETETFLPSPTLPEEWALGSSPDTSQPIRLSDLWTAEVSTSPPPLAHHIEDQVTTDTLSVAEELAVLDSSQTTHLVNDPVVNTDLNAFLYVYF